MNESGKRKSKGPDFRVYVGTSFPNNVFCEIEALAKNYQTGNAQVVRQLFLRGLAAYHRDGKLGETTVEETNELISTVNQFADEDAANIAA